MSEGRTGQRKAPETGTRQLSLALPPTVALEAEDFFVSDANRAAWAQVMAPEWPNSKLVLVGAEGAGKSHLARVWAAQTGARIVPASALDGQAEVDRPAHGGPAVRDDAARVVIEDADTLPPSGEEALFHLHNRLAQGGGRLLLTARTPPSRWSVELPDLASRMQACAVARIDDPDDDLLRAVLLKHFADRQLSPTPRVIDYLSAHIERSFAAIAHAVARLDVMALSQRSAITLTLARAVVAPDGLPFD